MKFQYLLFHKDMITTTNLLDRESFPLLYWTQITSYFQMILILVGADVACYV